MPQSVFSCPLLTQLHSFKRSVADLVSKAGAHADKAFYLSGVVILSIQDGESSQVHVLKHTDGDFTPTSSWLVKGETTALCLCRISGRYCAVIASSADARPVVSLFSLDGEPIVQEIVHGAQGEHLIVNAC